MERLVGFGTVLALLCLSHTSAQHSSESVDVDNGRIGVASITGGNFGPHSFSIGNSPGGRPKTQENYEPPRSISEESFNSGGFNSGNTQLYPVESLTNTNNNHGGKKGSEAGQILNSAVMQNNNKHIKDKKRRGNKQPTQTTLDASAIEAIFGSNGGSKGSSYDMDENIQIDAITGGNFKEETLSINNNGKPGINVLQTGSSVNNENTGNTNAAYIAPESKGHHAENNGAGNAGVGSNHGNTKSSYNSNSNDERWIWTR